MGIRIFVLQGGTRKIKCGADERRRRGLDRADPLFSPIGENANESLASHQKEEDASASSSFCI